MSEQEPLKGSDGKQVSKSRKIVSGFILIGLLVVLGIEVRAGFGHSATANAMQEVAPGGAFGSSAMTIEQVEAMMVLWPTKEELELQSSIGRIEYKYSWKSVIRPLMSNMAPTDLYVSYVDKEPRHALYFGTDAPEEFRAPKVVQPLNADGGISAAPDGAASKTVDMQDAAGDTAAGDTAAGDTAAGDTAAGDTAAGDTAAGEVKTDDDA